MRANELIEVLDDNRRNPVPQEIYDNWSTIVVSKGKQVGSYKQVDIFCMRENNVDYYAAMYNSSSVFYSKMDLLNFPQNSASQDLVNRSNMGIDVSGISYHVVFSVYLSLYDYVLSGKINKKAGQVMWTRLRKHAVDNGYEIGVVNLDAKKLIPYDDMSIPIETWFSQYRGSSEELGHIRYYIKRK